MRTTIRTAIAAALTATVTLSGMGVANAATAGDELIIPMIEDGNGLADSDRDGIPDDWERNGVVLKDGTVIPLPDWGADPNTPDIFLQLNWMASEWEQLGCFDNDADATCAQANTKSYRPSTKSLEELVDVFADNGYNLHVDAGKYYTNIPNYGEGFGGQTIDYAKYYFNGTSKAMKLLQNQKDILGERANIFRLGVIGDQINQGDYTTGVATIGNGSFYVANHSRMTTEVQLRNTIMHEFGHNLGLRHNGAKDHVDGLPGEAHAEDYRSVMNYKYQFEIFNYSTGGYTYNHGGVTREIPADWDNLTLDNGRIGRDSEAIGAPAAKAENVDRSAIATAEKANRTATIAAAEAPAKVKAGEQVALTYTITNPGLDVATYTIEATAPGAYATQTVTLPGALSGRNTTEVTFDVTATDAATMPVTITVDNGEDVVAQTTTVVNVEATPVAYEGQTNATKKELAQEAQEEQVAEVAQVATTQILRDTVAAAAETVKVETVKAETVKAETVKAETVKAADIDVQPANAEVAAAKTATPAGPNIAAIVGPIIALLVLLGLGAVAAMML